jgi:hypothetical protein
MTFPVAKKRRRRKNAADRFNAKVDRRGPDDCWPWTGACTNGYGSFRPGGEAPAVSAHSFAKFLDTGVACPPDMQAQHTCKTPESSLCCNPAHVIYAAPGITRTPGPPARKVTDAQAREIIRRCAAGETQRAVAADYGVTQPFVSNLVTAHRRGELTLETPHG